jgi:hypothetical protein
MSTNDTKNSEKENSKDKQEEFKGYSRCSHNYVEYCSSTTPYFKCTKCNDVKIGGGRWTYNPK